jgi:pimeloyl-ACP methyl ester carboxylesterase
MKALLWDYQDNPPRYASWQAWLRRRQPRVLAIWGKNDPFFIPPGAHAFARDAKDTTVVLLDTGHFALEEEADVVSEGVNQLMTTTFA